jgi:hypothetical protein
LFLTTNVNSDANIEAAVYPFLHIYNVAYVRRSEAEMVGSDGFYNLSIPVKMSKESDFLISVAQLM